MSVKTLAALSVVCALASVGEFLADIAEKRNLSGKLLDAIKGYRVGIELDQGRVFGGA